MTDGVPETSGSMATMAPAPDEAGRRGCLADHYQRNRGRLLRTAMRLLKDRTSAEDAVQETWVRALQSYGPNHSDSPPFAWLHRVTVNICYDQLRAGVRKRTTSLSTYDQEGAADPEITGMSTSAEEEALRAETVTAVNGAVDSLPPALREAVVLREYGGFKYAEIAEAVGCPIGTVMSRLYMARKRLRERLGYLLEVNEDRPGTGQDTPGGS